MADIDSSQVADAPESRAAARYEMIPSVNDVVDCPAVSAWADRVPRSVMVAAARTVLDRHRAQLANGQTNGQGNGQVTVEHFGQAVCEQLAASEQPSVRPVINATGIILHTGLGRAPMADEAVEAMAAAARRYAAVEMDLTTGQRGRRTEEVRNLLCALTGAESATVVNNNAAALLIVLNTIANGRQVLVSRGELIEIGGSFRLPQIMAASGAVLAEVGTTNKTRLKDYEAAIDDETAAIMKVHTSNYQIVGFTQSVAIAELAELGRCKVLAVIDDIGSGALFDYGCYGLAGEPNAAESIRAGADLVLFSGDKLLGGPQAGVILGRQDWINRIEANPMYRALRVDKLTLPALSATLRLHRDPATAQRRIPVIELATTPVEQLADRAEQLAATLRAQSGLSDVKVHRDKAYLGGGSLPACELDTVTLQLRPATVSDHELAQRLRCGEPPVVARVHDGCIVLDLRTIFTDQDAQLVTALAAALVDQ